MAINNKCIIWVEGPKYVGKTKTVETLFSELKENGYKVNKIHLDVQGGSVLQKIDDRLNLYNLNQNTDDLVTIVDSSLLTTLVEVYNNPHTKQTRDVEVKALFEYEAYLIPDFLVPTHIFLLINPPYEKSQETWYNYKKECEAYEELFTKDYIRDAFKNTKTTLIKLRTTILEERVRTIYDFLQ